MKKIQIICIFIFIICAGNEVLYAQKTVYEKKVLEIKKKYIKKIMLSKRSWTQKMEAELTYATETEINASFTLAVLSSPNDLQNLKNELKQADKLKTSIDIQRDKSAKAKKEIEDKERKISQQKEKQDATDIAIIKKNIGNAFENWNKKGEFEKETDYSQRIKDQSQKAFSKICIEKITEKVREINDEIHYANEYFKRELSTYNSESETFNTSFKINSNVWINKINIPITDAENFKKNWPDLDYKIEDYDWCFINNNLCPTLVTLYNTNNKYEFPLPLKNQSDITYSFDNFHIDNPYLKGYVFKYSNAKIIQQQSSVFYSNRLDSIFKDYNIKLLQNPFNKNKEVIKDYDKLKSEVKKNNNYKSSLENKTSKYNNHNNNFKQKLETQNPKEYCRIYYSQNPDKKLEADKTFVICGGRSSTSREDFDNRFINGNYSSNNCLENYYSKEKIFFKNRAEFDSIYNQAKDLHVELEIHKFQVFAIMNSSFKYKYILQNYNSELGRIRGEPSAEDLIREIRSGYIQNEFSHRVMRMILNYKEEKYYEKIIAILIDTNNDLKTEWTTNGAFFTNKIGFYNAYISTEYKQILKNNKH